MAITLNQIAEICGVSRGTVDRALHNKGNVRPAVAERIKAVANEYGYTPNRAGLALSRTSHPIRIGVIMFSVQTPFMQIVLDAARREAAVWLRSAWRSSSGCRPRSIRSNRSR